MFCFFFFFKQKTAYEMRISDWSSDVCSSDLKADGLFRDLQVQLEGTENRIAVARGRYVQSVQAYNVLVRQFPGVITAKIFGYAPKANFGVDNEAAISRPPEIRFSNDASAPKPAQ